MRWMKIGPACEHAGNLNHKLLYAAVEKGELKVARVGAGRNILFCDLWLDEWLIRSATDPKRNAPTAATPRGASMTMGERSDGNPECITHS